MQYVKSYRKLTPDAQSSSTICATQNFSCYPALHPPVNRVSPPNRSESNRLPGSPVTSSPRQAARGVGHTERGQMDYLRVTCSSPAGETPTVRGTSTCALVSLSSN